MSDFQNAIVTLCEKSLERATRRCMMIRLTGRIRPTLHGGLVKPRIGTQDLGHSLVRSWESLIFDVPFSG